MSIFLIFILILYGILITALLVGFQKVKNFHLKSEEPFLKFSIVIPFRNEAENLPQLLQSILALDYPSELFEIIFVDDESSDYSVQIIQSTLLGSILNFRILNNVRTCKSPKKDAISTAVKHANFDWIITTDADCELPIHWMQCYNNFILLNNSDFVVAPVAYHANTGWFKAFQTLDFMSLQGTTVGTFGLQQAFLSNGANMAYKKSLFQNLNGFSGNDTIASGDDVFLLQKAMQAKQYKIDYLKSEKVIVYTNPVATLNELLSQRIRWASKATAYKSWFSIAIGLIVFATNTALILALIFGLIGWISAKIILVLWTGKAILDVLLLYKTADFLNQESVLKYILVSSLIYPFFNVFVVFSSFFKDYQWKNRSFNK